MLDTSSSLTETASPSLRKAFLRLGNACKLRGVVNTETLYEIRRVKVGASMAAILKVKTENYKLISSRYFITFLLN
jgi:hypothetical protein